jgi:hypothetical protein
MRKLKKPLMAVKRLFTDDGSKVSLDLISRKKAGCKDSQSALVCVR